MTTNKDAISILRKAAQAVVDANPVRGHHLSALRASLAATQPERSEGTSATRDCNFCDNCYAGNGRPCTAPVRTASEAKADAAPVAKPVVRLHEYTSDRPYTEGKKFFEMTVLDSTQCVDGIELYAAHPPATDSRNTTAGVPGADQPYPNREDYSCSQNYYEAVVIWTNKRIRQLEALVVQPTTSSIGDDIEFCKLSLAVVDQPDREKRLEAMYGLHDYIDARRVPDTAPASIGDYAYLTMLDEYVDTILHAPFKHERRMELRKALLDATADSKGGQK